METDHAAWMKLAIEQAQQGIGLTGPNPPVGAVIVKEGKLLGEGWHHRAGKPHAEREALADVRSKHPEEALHGATIYITLEPCSTQGRTPPCTQGIIDAKIHRVVYGSTDPNPAHRGSAKALLTGLGMEVISGVCEQECDHLIRAFAKKQRTGLPWLIIKSAMSLDGRITRPPGEGQWLTSPESRRHVQVLRHESDAIITGGNTLRADNPSLTIRELSLPEKPQPLRMVITRGTRAELVASFPDAHLFTDAHAESTLVQEEGDVSAALETLADRGCNQVMVEAGGKLLEAFLASGHVDEVALFYAPLVTGGPDLAIVPPFQDIILTDQHFQRIGNDVLLRAMVQKV
ncbi:MAG: bifunctional diaminohydroxyphosphoribosylaminopyrimidine deaminase/5-amino-6-(5-phosphoribosylamino)uracil reductase RibD [Akkermansiaceae bacterium]